MSAAPTQIAVAQTASTLGTNSAQIQKEFLEEPLARQNSVGNRTRGGLKGKYLTRSHAMRESTSPPRTPTPRLSTDSLGTVATVQTTTISGNSSLSGDNNLNDTLSSSSLQSTKPIYVQSSGTSTSPPIMIEPPPPVIITTQNLQQSQQQQNHSNVVIYPANDLSPSNSGVICNDVDFPKLTPPKSSKDKQNSTTGNEHKLSSPPSASSMVVMSSTTTSASAAAAAITDTQQQIYFNGNKKNNCIINVDKTTATIINGQQQSQNSNRVHSPSTNRNSSDNFIASSSSSTTTITSSSLHNNNSNNNNSGSGVNIGHINNSYINQSQQLSSPPIIASTSYDKENRCPRNESQNSNNSGTYSQDENHNNNNNNNNHNNMNCLNESQNDISGKSDRLGKKHRNGANSKGSKPRLKNMSGSSSSMEGGNSTSGFISRDSSTEQFTDQSGVDLLQFFKDTLNKNTKDRNMLVKIEKDLIELAHDKARVEMRFPAMSSYNRMLIHRVAAFFGMEHNVDQATQQCVIVAPTKATRIPDIRFKTLFRERMTDEPRKSILKRDVHSFDDCRQSYLSCPDRGVLDRKAKSFEEREEEYEKIRRKIFLEGDDEQQQYWHYANNGGNNDQSARLRQNNKLLKVQSLPMDRHGGRPSVSKAHSFGGYGGPPQSGGPLQRGDSVNSNKSAGPRLFKQDSVSSTNQSWRLSPSSSGSIYHFDPSNLPPSQAVASGMYNSNNHNHINNSKNNNNIGVPPINRKKHDNRQQRNIYNKQDNNIIQYSNSSSSSSGSTELNCNSAINNTVETISISTSTNNESSIETLSETSSAQTVVNINQNNNSNTSNQNESEDIPIITKENINREMDDIEEEIVNNSYADNNNDKTTLKIDNVQQEKPKFINQATSPNIPTPEPEELSSTSTPAPVSNEIIKITTKSNSITDNQNVSINASTRSTPLTSSVVDIRKDDLKLGNSTNIPIMSYTTSYQTIDGTTVFQPAGSATPYSTTTYQQGPDGSVYAVPQQMVYTYPPQMDGEIQGYFVYDQSAGPRDNSGLIAGPGQTIYQSTPGGAVVPVATYPSPAPYGGGPIYQQQVVYSPEQFQNGAATAAAQMQQYPVTTYPVGYSYPYNGYWGQTMAYYVPQPAIANAVSSSIMPPPSLPIVSGAPGMANGQPPMGNPNNGTPGIIVHAGSGNVAGGGGKQRNTPPHHHQQQQHHHHHHHHHNNHQQHHQQNLSSGQSSQSTTPAGNTTYQFAAAGVPVAIASDQNGQPMYIPQSAVFPNMLPYGPPNAQSTPAGVLTHLPPQSNTVISPMISHPGSGGVQSGGPPPLHIPMEPPTPQQHPQPLQHSTTYTTISTNSSHGGGSIGGNRSGTPQSAPSTPLSNPMPSAHHQRNNPPLFATPPMIPNGFNSHITNNPYQSYTESQQPVGGNSGGTSSYDKKNSYSIAKKSGGAGSNSNGSGYSSNNRQNSYNSNQQRKTHENQNNTLHNYSSGNTGNNNNSSNTRQIYASQPKKPPSGNSSLSSNGGGNGVGGSASLMGTVNHNNNISNTSNSAQNNNTDIKSRPGGIRQKPGNLDFKRNGSQRNSPSTNSAESNNNSPNSIASNQNHMSGSSSGNNSSTGGPASDHHHQHHHQIQHLSHHQQQQQQHHHHHSHQQQQQQSQTMYMTRGTHIPPMHQPTTAVVAAAAAAAAANDAAAACHQPLIGTYNHPAPGGMYFKYGQTYFAHPSVALPNNRRSPPNDIRPSLAPLYPTVNMMLPAPRQMQPRHPNPNYKGNKPLR